MENCVCVKGRPLRMRSRWCKMIFLFVLTLFETEASLVSLHLLVNKKMVFYVPILFYTTSFNTAVEIVLHHIHLLFRTAGIINCQVNRNSGMNPNFHALIEIRTTNWIWVALPTELSRVIRIMALRTSFAQLAFFVRSFSIPAILHCRKKLTFCK